MIHVILDFWMFLSHPNCATGSFFYLFLSNAIIGAIHTFDCMLKKKGGGGYCDVQVAGKFISSIGTHTLSNPSRISEVNWWWDWRAWGNAPSYRLVFNTIHRQPWTSTTRAIKRYNLPFFCVSVPFKMYAPLQLWITIMLSNVINTRKYIH